MRSHSNAAVGPGNCIAPCLMVAALCAMLFACSNSSGPSTPPIQARALQAAADYTVGSLSAPTGVPIFLKTVIGDLDGDGRNDVVTFTNATINGSDVVVLYQDQSGRFSTFASFNSVSDLGLSSVTDIAIGDMNGDGLADLVIFGIAAPVSVGFGPPLVVLYQDPTGNLGPPVPWPVIVGGLPLGVLWDLGIRIAIGDLNSDGRNDVAIAGVPITVLLQNSDGSLGTGVGSTFRVTGAFTFPLAAEVHIADMDGDGDNDIVFQTADKFIGVSRQTAPGVFSSTPDLYPVTLSYFSSFDTFAVGDVNGDGKSDVVVLDPGNSGTLNIFLQNNQGMLDAPRFVPITSSPLYRIEIADIDKDGLNDIVGDVVDAGFPTGVGQVHVFYQKSDHTFGTSTMYTFATSAGGGSQSHQSLSIGDINGDGWPDAVVSWLDEGIFVLKNVPQ